MTRTTCGVSIGSCSPEKYNEIGDFRPRIRLSGSSAPDRRIDPQRARARGLAAAHVRHHFASRRRERPRSPRSCCCMPGPSSWLAPFGDERRAVTPPRTGWRSSRSAAFRSRPRRSSSSSKGGGCPCSTRPGHKDFSEDTYRALIAADSVVMVIDAANGVEDQTRKLFEVCRRHRLPILTFINKLDRPSRDPAGAAGRSREDARHRRRAGQLADRQRGELPRRVRHPAQPPAAVRARSAGAVSCPGRHLVARRSGRPGAHRRERLRAFPREPRRHRRRRHAVRRRRLPRRRPDAGVLRQRAHEFRPRAVPAGARRARPVAAAAFEP